jgi:hypothetical protein
MVLAAILCLLILPLSPLQTLQPAELNALLDRAAENARRYTNEMRNLTADENRATELYAKNGTVQKRRQTRASLVVHQAGESTLAEFRRVFEVDGKPVKTNENRLELLLRNLANAESTVRELELIQQESSKYDLEEMRMRGMSLNQAWPLEDPAFRQSAAFRIEGKDTIAGREAVVVRYESFVRDPDAWRAQNVRDLFTPTRIFERGRIWIDSATAQIWRYETETMVEEPTLSEAAVWDRMEFHYVASSFGIPTVQRIVWITNTNVSRDRGKLRLSLKGKLVAEYGPFRRFGAEVTKITPVNPQ